MQILTCTQILKDNLGRVTGYTLKNQAEQLENYSLDELHSLISFDEIKVDNLVYNDDLRRYVFDTKRVVNDSVAKKLTNKATILGLENKEIRVVDNKIVHYIKQSEDSHIIYIPTNVNKLYDTDTAFKNEFKNLMKTLSGTVKFIGGEGLTDVSNMFGAIKTNATIDLTELNLSKVKDMSLMFCYSKLNKVIFGEVNLAHVETMYSMFKCATIREIDMSRVRATRVLDFRMMFYGCNAQKVNIGFIDAKRGRYTLGMGTFDEMFKYDKYIEVGVMNLKTNCPFIQEEYNNSKL